MINTNKSEQKIQLERKRLTLSDVVLRTRQETLHKICDSFHFNNTDLLDIEFKEYLYANSSFNRAYSVITALTASEIDALMPHIHAGHTIVQECLKLADQKEQQQKQQKRQQRLNAVRHALNPLVYLASLMPKKTNARAQSTPIKIGKQTETR